MRKQCFILGVALLLGGTSCTKDFHRPATLTVSTFAGSGQAGWVDGIGTSASFYNPASVAIDAAGNLYVADHEYSVIRKVTPKAVVTTLAGSGSRGFADGQGMAASFFFPFGLAVDASGFIYVADYYNNRIRKISPAGLVTTLAGSGEQGAADGKGIEASFNGPRDVALDASGNVYVSDGENNLIRKISQDGVVTTFAGSGMPGAANGKGSAASFYNPDGLAVDKAGNIYVADGLNCMIRKINPDGVVTTLAGNTTSGAADGKGLAASFYDPTGIALDAYGNLYVADYGNNKIRKVTPQGDVTTVAGNGVYGFANGSAASASFRMPYDVAIDNLGNIYVADFHNQMIRKIQMSR